MGRIMAIDYGTKRVGIAVTDPLQLIANGLTTVHSKDVVSFLENYFKQEVVDLLVIGEPKRLNNEPSESATFVESFIKNLKKKFTSTPIVRIDERFTSKMALQTMIDGGVKKSDRKNKALLDEISATIILQSYLEQRTFNKNK